MFVELPVMNRTRRSGKEGWDYVTREEVEGMIAEAIRRHNRNAGAISAIVGWVVLGLFADGVLRLVGVVSSVKSCNPKIRDSKT